MRAVWKAGGLAVLGFVAAATISGCGNDCGTGTKLQDGECVPDEDSVGPIRCGDGTDENDGVCTAPEPDGGVPDQGDGPPPGDAVCPGESLCGDGLRFVAEDCSCEDAALPPRVAVTDTKLRAVENAFGGSFVREGEGLSLYWTSTAAGDDLGAFRQTINTKTLELEGEPEAVKGLGPRVLSPAASADGLWLAWSCARSDQGLPARRAFDLCIASRADTNSAWGNIRAMTEIGIFGGTGPNMVEPQPSTGPEFVSGPGGAPVALFFGASNPTIEGGSGDVCVANFDAATGMGQHVVGSDMDCDDGVGGPNPSICAPMGEHCVEGTLKCRYTSCIGFQLYDGSSKLPPVIVSDNFNTELGPAWSADGSLFAWTKGGTNTQGTTQGYDIWLGRSSNADGTVDEFLGRLSTNTANNELELGFAPDKSGAIVWTEIVDLTDLSKGSFLSLGRLNVPSQ